MGVVESPRTHVSNPPPGLSSRAFNFVARLLAWYTLSTVLFRCPIEPTDSSPTVCHAYSKVRTVVYPHLQPYYEAYASPYVMKITPYISHANEAYIYPGLELASASYEKYAQPTLSKTKIIAEKEYEKTLYPHVSKASSQVKDLYDQHLATYFSQVNDLYTTITSSPAYISAKGHAYAVYKVYVTPAYARISPYLRRGWDNGKYVTIVIVAPHVKEGLVKGGEWFDKTIWSSVRGVWQGYVEVQVGRIRNKLSSNSSFIAPSDKKLNSASLEKKKSPGSTFETKAAREAARKKIEDDLAKWTEKFEEAADKAIIDLNKEVDKIATSAIATKKPTVDGQLKKLDKTIENDIRALKAKVINIVKAMRPAKNDEEKQKSKVLAFEELFEATKNVGAHIKETVQNMRWDSQRFLASVYDEVTSAADSHIEAVDALIEDGIQELGVKWDWATDGIPHTEWARYNDLKKEFSGIRAKVVKSAEKNKKLLEVTNWAEGTEWEEGALTRAKEAVAELARLKRIGKKKIEMNDYTEDFSDKYLDKTTDNASQKVLKVEDNIEEPVHEVFNIVAASEPALEESSVSSISAEAEKPYTRIVVGKANAGFVQARKVEYEDEDPLQDTITEKIKDSVDDAIERLEHASKAVSEAMFGTKTSQPVGESITSVASEKYSAALSAASSALYGTPTPIGEAMVSIATDKYSAAVAAASSVIYGTPTPWPEKAYIAYQDAVGSAVESFQQVLHSANVAVNGEPQPAHESVLSVARESYSTAVALAQEKYAQAISAASTAVYGEPQPTHESLLSVAGEKYAAATSSAQDKYSSLVYRASQIALGTPAPHVESLASKASEYAAAATLLAEERVASMQALISELVYGKEPDFTESVMSKFSELVYGTEPGVVAKATSAMGETYQSASSVVVNAITPPPAIESILSAANEQIQSAIDVASEQVYGREKGSVEKATSAAAEAYESAASQVSEAIYGRETGAFESATLKIAEAASSASSLISEALYGTPTPQGTIESFTSVIGETYDSAAEAVGDKISAAGSAISENYEAAQAKVSGAIYGPEYEKIIESAQERLRDAVESAKVRLSELFLGEEVPEGYGEKATRKAGEAVESAKSVIGNVIEEVSKVVVVSTTSSKGKVEEVVSSATEKVKDTYQSVKDEL